MSNFESAVATISQISDIEEDYIESATASFDIETGPFDELYLTDEPLIRWHVGSLPSLGSLVDGVNLVEVLQTIQYDINQLRAKMRQLGYEVHFLETGDAFKKVVSDVQKFHSEVKAVMTAFANHGLGVYTDGYNPVEEVAHAHGLAYVV